MTPAKRLILMGRPLINAVVNGSFEDDLTGWTPSSGSRVLIGEDNVLHGTKSLKLTSDGSGNATVFHDVIFPNDNNIYIFAFVKCTQYTSGDNALYVWDYGGFENAKNKILPKSTFDWTLASVIKTAANGGIRLYPALVSTPIATVYFDAIGAVDITNLPAEQQTLEWCDANIPQMFYSGVI